MFSRAQQASAKIAIKLASLPLAPLLNADSPFPVLSQLPYPGWHGFVAMVDR